MKKFMFTAIALVAFSGISMGNTITAGENLLENEAKDVKIIRTADPCLGAYVNTYNANVAEYGNTVAGQIANGAWNACRSALGLEEI